MPPPTRSALLPVSRLDGVMVVDALMDWDGCVAVGAGARGVWVNVAVAVAGSGVGVTVAGGVTWRNSF